VQGTALPFTVSDADGDPIVTYRFTDLDSTGTSAHLWFNGSNLAQGATVDVPASQLSGLWEQGGSVVGTDTLQVQALDGMDWSIAQNITRFNGKAS